VYTAASNSIDAYCQLMKNSVYS